MIISKDLLVLGQQYLNFRQIDSEANTPMHSLFLHTYTSKLLFKHSVRKSELKQSSTRFTSKLIKMDRKYESKQPVANTSSYDQNCRNLIAKAKSERKPEESLGCDGSRRGSSTPTHSRHKPVELVFKDVCVSQKEKLILKGISGMVRPGEILAVMGPSGSGKTTLLNAIGGRSSISSGMVTFNGEELNKQWRRKVSYVLQQDIFFPELTLKNTLIYVALLRLPESMPKSEKLRHVENIIDILDLRACQNTIIGDAMKRGLSGGEKKRANIACELLTNPSILLLDEPTSGLDSSTAFSVMKCLKTLANQSRSLVLTVHQPSSQIFYMFDKLLLLCNGQVAYFGYASKVVDYFSTLGMQIKPHYNPADFIMEQVKKDAEITDMIINAAHKQRKDNDYPKELLDEFYLSGVVIESTSPYEASNEKSVDHLMPVSRHQMIWSQINRSDETCEPCSDSLMGYMSQESMDQHAQVELGVMIDPDKKLTSVVYSKVESRDDDDSGRSSWSEVATSSAFSSQMDLNEEKKWPTSFFTQVLVLTSRNSNECWKKILSPLNFIQTVSLGLITGACWYGKKRTEKTIDDVDGWIFFCSSYWMLFSLFGALVSFPPEREVVNKERASGSYRLSAYYIAKMISELPLVITLPTIFHSISYSMLGIYSAANFFIQLGLLLIDVLVSQSVGLFIGAACYNIQTAITASAIYSLSTMLFGGYYSASLPFWLNPVRFTSMVYYAFKNMQIVEYGYGKPLSCATNNSLYESCYRTNSTGFIEYEDIVGRTEPFGLLGNTLILILFLIVFRVLGYIVLRCRTP
ncbi:ABC transporter G family member 9 [Trichonephila inaurata madagascariensis]|uniref:ABC transporter G family member 9 n=1 Tax=Trichonephila inaurata madagascariensis TaxID=2747483 RepID=A0A8X6XQN0_9ARAC|nr:ABC transporter G family member 9 [Trichonephila inaurata madagascariensis]